MQLNPSAGHGKGSENEQQFNVEFCLVEFLLPGRGHNLFPLMVKAFSDLKQLLSCEHTGIDVPVV